MGEISGTAFTADPRFKPTYRFFYSPRKAIIKNVATGRQIGIVVRRACPFASFPEGKLFLSVIEQALVEADAKKPSIHESARRFLRSQGMIKTCELIGLDHDYVAELIHDHAAWMRPMEGMK